MEKECDEKIIITILQFSDLDCACVQDYYIKE